MGFIAQNTVADVVKMRNLNVIEENGVFDLGRIADDAVFAYERTAPYKGAMPYTAVRADYARRGYRSARRNFSAFMRPDGRTRSIRRIRPCRGSESAPL